MPFETVVQGDYALYLQPEPRLILIANHAEAEKVAEWLQGEALAHLLDVDFSQNTVIALLRGSNPSSGYDTTIEEIVKQVDRTVVLAHFWEPSPYWQETAEGTSYYYLVKVPQAEVPPDTALQLQPYFLTPTPPPQP